MTTKLMWLMGWATVALISIACSTDLPAVPTLQVTSTSTFVVTAHLTSTPTGRPTRTPQPTETVVKRQVPVLPPASPSVRFPNLKVQEIEDGYRDEVSVETAFWSGDGKLLYAFSPADTQEKTLTWKAYDLATGLSSTIASPLKYNSIVWQRLKVPEPYKETSVHPELRGYVSPSGKYVIYSIEYGDVSLGSTDSTARREFWLADSRGQWKIKLLGGFLLGGISNVEWRKNETRAIFDYGYEGGVRLYIADIQNGAVVSLKDMSDFERGTEQIWAVSPDGNTLAVSDLDLTLNFVNLESGKTTLIDGKVRYPQWSKDGKTLYYWWGPEFENVSIRAYDLASGKITDLVDVPSLKLHHVPPTDFAVAPHGDEIAFWNGGLWLVKLLK